MEHKLDDRTIQSRTQMIGLLKKAIRESNKLNDQLDNMHGILLNNLRKAA